MSSKLIYLALFITIAASHPLPQRLTEQEFRAFKTNALNPDNNVDIFGGYAKIRRQGRNHNGRSISFSKPFTVRDPLEFAAAGRNLGSSRNSFQPPRDKIQKFPEVAPVFNLEEMLKAEAEKLRMRVEEASLMAAKAVEEAEQKVQELAHEAASDIPEKEIEDMIEKIVDSAIDEAQDIIEFEEEEKEMELSTEQSKEVVIEDYNSDEVLNEIIEEENNVNEEEISEETTENAQPSSDIDLGSVLEV